MPYFMVILGGFFPFYILNNKAFPNQSSSQAPKQNLPNQRASKLS